MQLQPTSPIELEADLAAWADGLRPDRELTVSQWAEAYRWLPQAGAAAWGPYRVGRTPPIREIMDLLSVDSGYHTVVLMKGTQLGGTEAANNWIGYIIDHAPGPTMMIQPTVEDAREVSKSQLAPMLEDTPALKAKVREPRSRDSGNTILHKVFPGGVLALRGANSARGMRRMPVRNLILDEVDGYPADVDGEGDPLKLAEKRTSTYGERRKILILSTPTIRDLSRIERAFGRGDQRYYEVPCPFCGIFQRITWGAIKWEPDPPEKAGLECAGCHVRIAEHHKPAMLAGGRWVATAQGEPGVASFHLSSLYSPYGWYSWAQAARDFLAAKHASPEEMKTWSNTVLAETWSAGGALVEPDALMPRRQSLPDGIDLAEGVLVLTAGIDVQDNRLEIGVWGWGRNERSWPIDHRVLYGDTSIPNGEVWRRADDALLQTYLHANGHQLRIAAVCIDTAGHRTREAYVWVKPRQVRNVYAIVGREGRRPIVSAPARRKQGRQRIPVDLFIVGTDEAKDVLHGRLQLQEVGPGYVQFLTRPCFDEEWFEQLTSEQKVIRYRRGFPLRQWVKRPGRKNEVLDCWVYAYAALVLLQPSWDALQARYGQKIDAQPGAGSLPMRQPRRRIRINRN